MVFTNKYDILNRIGSFLFAMAVVGASTAAGQTWLDLPNAPVTSRHNDVFFVSPDTGWVVSGTAEIHRTTDGGSTWQLQLRKMDAHFRSVGFLDARRGWVGSVGPGEFGTTDPSLLYRTEDGGETWSAFSEFHGRTPGGLCGMQVVNDSTIVAVGRVRGPSFFIKTTDGGRTWRTKDMRAHAAGLIDVYFPHPDTGFAVGLTNEVHDLSSGVVLATTDGGTTWETRFTTSRTGEWNWKLSFPSRRVGYASLQRNRLSPIYFLKTTDGGETWEEKLFSSTHYLVQGIGFVTETNGWIGGNSTQMPYETRDGGETWSPVEIGPRLNRFRFLGDSLGYGVGSTVHKFVAPPPVAVEPGDVPLDGAIVDAVYPNPSRSRGTMSYSLPQPQAVTIAIYDVQGRLVKTLENGIHAAGRHEAVWDGTTARGRAPAGVYFWVLRSGGVTQTRPVLHLP